MIPLGVWIILLGVEETAVLAAILWILRRPTEPRGMLAWILALRFLPVLGLMLWFFLGEPRRQWHRSRRRRSRLQASLAHKAEMPTQRPLCGTTPATDPSLVGVSTLARRLGAYAASSGNEVTLYQGADETLRALRSAIESARSHVHLEYYIFQPDDTGRAIRDLLIAKSREGVQCRLLLDYVGCWHLPRRFLRPLREAAGEVAFAMPVIPWRGRWRVNYRNHRKIAVIDGKVGFTGSQNIGDEYGPRQAMSKPWRNTHLRIAGPAVHQLQEVFVHDWHYTTRENPPARACFPHLEPVGGHTVQVVPSGPDRDPHVMHQLLFAAVSSAQSSVCVITPYFVPDSAMILALQSACYRGVRVQLLIPTCSDHRVVLWAGRSYYRELTAAGIEIFEHDETMLHSKVMIVDQNWAMVGSANMDERSFKVSFEVNTMLYNPDLARQLYRDFETLRARSRRIRPKDLSHPSFKSSMVLGLARLASPLL